MEQITDSALDRLFEGQRRRMENKMAGVWSRTEQYRVCALSDDIDEIPDWYAWSLTVEWRSEGLWAVCWHSECLSVRKGTTKATAFPGGAGKWSWERSSSNRNEQWIRNHRFTFKDAMRAAEYWAPRIRVNGLTASDVLTRYQERQS